MKKLNIDHSVKDLIETENQTTTTILNGSIEGNLNIMECESSFNGAYIIEPQAALHMFLNYQMNQQRDRVAVRLCLSDPQCNRTSLRASQSGFRKDQRISGSLRETSDTSPNCVQKHIGPLAHRNSVRVE